MRITAGKFKAQRVKTVENNDVRPTSSKVRESIFNIIQSSITNAVMLDLFAGSGVLGLEALSRGAKQVIFTEKNPKVFKILKENLSNFDCDTKCYLVDAFIAVEKFNEQQFDIIFIDPPYRTGYEFDICTKIIAKNILKDDGMLIIEHLSSLNMEEMLKTLPVELLKYKKYGDTALSIFEKIS